MADPQPVYINDSLQQDLVEVGNPKIELSDNSDPSISIEIQSIHPDTVEVVMVQFGIYSEFQCVREQSQWRIWQAMFETLPRSFLEDMRR